jgi:hypothetical protein
MISQITDLIGADCSKTLSTWKWNELDQYLAQVKNDNPTIELVEGYKGKHKVTFCSWLDTNGKRYKTDVYQIEVVKESEAGNRIQHHKANFKENTIIFWYEDGMTNGFVGSHVFKHSAEGEVGVWFGGTGHKVFVK